MRSHIRAAIRPCWLSLEMPPRDVDRHYMIERVRMSNIEVAIFIVVVVVAVALLCQALTHRVTWSKFLPGHLFGGKRVMA